MLGGGSLTTRNLTAGSVNPAAAAAVNPAALGSEQATSAVSELLLPPVGAAKNRLSCAGACASPLRLSRYYRCLCPASQGHSPIPTRTRVFLCWPPIVLQGPQQATFCSQLLLLLLLLVLIHHVLPLYCPCTAPLQDPQEAAFRSQVAKMMGDLGTSGDAPFGGEVALDAESQVRGWVGGRAGGRPYLSSCRRLQCMQPVVVAVAGHRAGGSCAAECPNPPRLNTCMPIASPAAPLLPPQVYWWHDKYRPRRPKYFNRVHTGYDWNKYNQTHYDGDNPPPKTVVVRARWLWWWGRGRQVSVGLRLRWGGGG